MTIKQKQWQLYFLGYYFAGIDGIWGAKSAEATEAFQNDFGLDPDGIFGPLTEAKSIEVVKWIQEAVGTYADGLAGPNTVEMTRRYQATNGLDADGIAGPLTRAEIDKEEEINWEEIKYFTREEFKCPCPRCGGFPVEPKKKLVKLADKVRGHFGAPALPSSGVRCQAHNDELPGSVPNSLHLTGRALDFMIVGKNAAQVLEYVWQQPEVNYAYDIDGTYVHMDVN